MENFWLWFTTGFQHILDVNGYDHILYIAALCVSFNYLEYKKLFLLITAFTLGHSLTLCFSVFNVININQALIEILIPSTILITCLINVFSIKSENKKFSYKYLLALVFGFIHGMGFSYLLKSLLSKEESIIWPLISFNIGLEIGQIIVVFVMLLISLILVRYTKLDKIVWVKMISISILFFAIYILIQRIILL